MFDRKVSSCLPPLLLCYFIFYSRIQTSGSGSGAHDRKESPHLLQSVLSVRHSTGAVGMFLVRNGNSC